jgi:hypothetical protein
VPERKPLALYQWALPLAAGGRLTRHPCQGAVQQLGLLYGCH